MFSESDGEIVSTISELDTGACPPRHILATPSSLILDLMRIRWICLPVLVGIRDTGDLGRLAWIRVQTRLTVFQDRGSRQRQAGEKNRDESHFRRSQTAVDLLR